jgi:hypothetical protein
MRDFPAEQKQSVLVQAFDKETFHLTRTEIIKQALKGDSVSAQLIYAKAIADADPLVRRAALENITKVPVNQKEETEKLLTDISYIVVEKALDVLSRSFPHDIPRYLEATKNETGWRGLNIRMKWLEIAIQAEQREYLGEITNYAGPNFEFETRINAFNLLRKLDYLDKKSAYNLIDGFLYWNYKVSNAAKDVLGYFYQQNKYKTLIDNTLLDPRISAEEKAKVDKMLTGK